MKTFSVCQMKTLKRLLLPNRVHNSELLVYAGEMMLSGRPEERLRELIFSIFRDHARKGQELIKEGFSVSHGSI
jgi:hypothetical protein